MEEVDPQDLNIDSFKDVVVKVADDSTKKEFMTIGHNINKSQTFMPDVKFD